MAILHYQQLGSRKAKFVLSLVGGLIQTRQQENGGLVTPLNKREEPLQAYQRNKDTEL